MPPMSSLLRGSESELVHGKAMALNSNARANACHVHHLANSCEMRNVALEVATDRLLTSTGGDTGHKQATKPLDRRAAASACLGMSCISGSTYSGTREQGATGQSQ